MALHNPPHPGAFIQATYMEPFNISCGFLAEHLNVSASALNRILKQQSGISPEMALRLSKALGRSPESWLAMQNAYDLWIAKKTVALSGVQRLNLDAA
jgi:antitoxin HigA-1